MAKKSFSFRTAWRGVIGVSVLSNMPAMFGKLGVKGLNDFRYLTVCSFYDYNSVLAGSSDWIYKMIFPAGIAIIAYIIGNTVFCRKNLPL